jgi:mono/diheme cytochrome c family protein
MNRLMNRTIAAMVLAGLLMSGSGMTAAQNAAPVVDVNNLFRTGGDEVFGHLCQGCHMPNAMGATGAGTYPALASNAKLAAKEYPVTMVLFGRRDMPPLGTTLNDTQIANVVNYVRSHFGNDYTDLVTPADVAKIRTTEKVDAQGNIIAALSAAVAPVKHNQGRAAIAKSVTVPPGYDTLYFSGGGAGAVPPGQDPGNTEAQATKALENIKQDLAEEGMTFGDVVMMHAYLGPDPETGQADRTGWGNAFGKFFGTPDQPNKPSRTSIQISFGGGPNLIEIEVIAVRPHKD